MEDHALAAAEIGRRLRKDRIVLGCAVLVGFAAIFFIVWPVAWAIKDYAPRTASIARVLEVGMMFTKYRINHDGKAPQRLSELFADDYTKTATPFFGGHTELARDVDRLPNGQTQRDLIDACSTCRLLLLPDGRAVLLEPLSLAKSEQVIYLLFDRYQPGGNFDHPPVEIKTWETFAKLAARQFDEPSAPGQ